MNRTVLCFVIAKGGYLPPTSDEWTRPQITRTLSLAHEQGVYATEPTAMPCIVVRLVAFQARPCGPDPLALFGCHQKEAQTTGRVAWLRNLCGIVARAARAAENRARTSHVSFRARRWAVWWEHTHTHTYTHPRAGTHRSWWH